MVTGLGATPKKPQYPPAIRAEQACSDIQKSLGNSYFALRSQIHVSLTPQGKICLRGWVGSYFLKQKAVSAALQHIPPELIEDHIEVIAL